MSTRLLLVFVAPCVLAWLVSALLARSAISRKLADVPNERSLHAVPTPRVGGIGIMIGALPFVAWLGGAALVPALACALFLAAISLMDDVRSLPVQVRLPAHAIAAAVVVLAAPLEMPGGAIVAALAGLAIVWSTNLFNFMDGADGLAGGMALVGFAVMAAVAHDAFPALALPAAAIASAAAGFLLLNFPPARLFMGDAGSIPLGFLAASFGWLGITHGVWPAWFPLLVFSPFLADATVTLARRALRRETLWRAHRRHYYQRLVLSGWSPRRLALAAYALMVAASAGAVVALREGGPWPWAIIALSTATYATIFIAIDRRAPLQDAR